MSGADSTTEVTPTGRYEAHSLGFLAANKVHKMVKFCVMAGAGSEFSLQAALIGAR